ncbi:MAG: hypothetical protein J7L95_07970 [Prolixibacteraceae bacterium]|nr:hypothetical protein [Prolixibacteraceae bacterium]
MKKVFLSAILFLSVVGIVNAQKSKFIGSWFITKVEVKGKIENPYQVTQFSEDGKMTIMGMKVGTWSYNNSTNSIVMRSEFDKDFNGICKIDKLDGNTLILTKDGVKMYYSKIDDAKIEAANKKSGLLGMWAIKDKPYEGITTLIQFLEPDKFKIIEKETGSESKLSGTWIFDKNKSSLIMTGLRGEDMLKGENRIIAIDENSFEFENNGVPFRATKKATNNLKIERLTFSEDDFYDENGDYKYSTDEEKLPWLDWEQKKNSLENVSQLVYSFAKLINDTKYFDTKILTANVSVTDTEEGFSIDNIFKGFDRSNLPEDAELPTNTEFDHPLYPLTENTFRIVATEQITTKAGTFNCTVLEVAADFDLREKLWMINDKPGIYAKIVIDDPDPSFGKYEVYELQEIK